MKKYKYHLILLLAGCCYSSLAIFTKLLSDYKVDPYNQVFWRMVIAMLISLAIAKAVNKLNLVNFKRNFKSIFINSILFFFGFLTFSGSIFLGTTIAKAIALNYAYPLIIVILSYLIMKELPSRKNIISIILSLTGVAILIEIWKVNSIFEIRNGDML